MTSVAAKHLQPLLVLLERDERNCCVIAGAGGARPDLLVPAEPPGGRDIHHRRDGQPDHGDHPRVQDAPGLLQGLYGREPELAVVHQMIRLGLSARRLRKIVQLSESLAISVLCIPTKIFCIIMRIEKCDFGSDIPRCGAGASL